MNKRLGYMLAAIAVTLLLVNHPPMVSFATASYPRSTQPFKSLNNENVKLLDSANDIRVTLDSLSLENLSKLVELETQQLQLKY